LATKAAEVEAVVIMDAVVGEDAGVTSLWQARPLGLRMLG
jgi:thymidine phosphorylase